MNCGKNLQLKGLYEAIALIGQGGMGRTFRAVDLGRLGQPCAIKQFLPQFREPQLMEKAIALFESEASQLKSLGSHPQIPELIAYFEEEGCLYLVQELIEGENLYNELQSQGIFSEAKIYQLLADILPVLQFIHDRQVIHRDIKPDNIVRKKKKEKKKKRKIQSPITNPQLPIPNYQSPITNFVLVDFGAAKALTTDTASRTGTLIGSAEYVAPEQARGKAVPQSDLYSLGVTCIHLLTGISPFDLYDDVSDRWIWREKLQAPISSHLANILDRLLARAIANRYRSANEVLQDLRSLNLSSVSAISPRSSSYIQSYSQAYAQIKQLQELLSLGQWQEGDRLTNKIILELADKHKIAELTADDIDNIACDIWIAIDQAWMEFSNQHFGWSTQKQIWKSLGGRLTYEESTYWEFANIYEKFSDRVGWRRPKWLNLGLSPKVWRKYENLIFAIAAPRGHLPSLFFWEGFNLVDIVLYRLEICCQSREKL
ncbi:serine/threonine-protein kinase [Pseudanabaena sp. Chao 1811]|uniref:serine/threonine-protein kinase n=1 Tax=Pseudanabaena sp. Chao 1811 TaxID=2963092 RepID=UPI0022F38AB9|nr:serine/threonine-protein kinase [Pseudanabaena sp. Chao 1811]